MTDFHGMTDQELNEWIARKRGWKKEAGVGQFSYPTYWWHKPKEYTRVEPPDYCNDWKWAGELEEEGRFDLIHDEIHNVWRALKINCLHVYVGRDKIATRAISEAYAVMTESLGDMTKKDGEQ